MTRFATKQAIDAAKEFIRRAEGIEWYSVEDRHYPTSTLATAATRRASMDLTRALAQMRRAVSGRYRTVVADPPWAIQWHGGGLGRHFSRPTLGYPTMTLDDIMALPVADLVADDAALFLWITAPLNREGVGVRVVRAWGFEPVGEFVWDKGMRIAGAFPRSCHEIALVCKRGNHQFTCSTWTASVQRWPVSKRGSQKPEAFTDLVEQVSPGPYVELFARRQRLGWSTFGDQAFNTAGFEVPA